MRRESVENKTVLEMLERHTFMTPDRTAVICEPQERISYKELWELSGCLYSWIKKRGIGAEDIVMFCLPRGISLFACMIGTMRAGAAFVLAESGNEQKRTEFIRNDCGCSLFVDEKDWEDIIRTKPLEGYEEIRLHSLCYIAYTSGTTSNPKGVLHEYGSMENAWKSVRKDGLPLLSSEDTFLVMSPMNFVSLPIIFAFYCAFGNAVALMPYTYAQSRTAFDDYMKKAGVNCGYVTPSFLRNHLPFRSPWRMCIMSSEPADGLFLPDMKCYNCYASTESGCLFTLFELPRAMTPAPVGRSQSDIEIYVLNEDEMECRAGTIGEVCFRNPYVRGYLNLPEKTQKFLRGRVLHSGDAGEIDSEGNLVLHGRLDEVFKIGGYRIDPDEVVRAVRQVSLIQHLVVRGFVYKDISSIVVFYTDAIEIDEVYMREQLLKLLPEYMIPTNYIRLRDFPLLETGKLDKLSLLPPEGSWDAFRKTSVSNLVEIGKGKTACVYDMGDGKAVKVFRPSIPFAMIRQELVLTQAAVSYGIPVPVAYEIVRSGPAYGIIMDKVPGEELEKVISMHPDDRKKLIIRFAENVKRLHQVRVQDERLPDVKAVSLLLAGQLPSTFCSGDDAQKIHAVFERLPDMDTFVHGDCHCGNAMIADGKIQFIDMMLSGKGHPVFDLLCMYSHYVFLPSFVSEQVCKSRFGMCKAEAEQLYDSFLRAYFTLAEDADLTEIKEQIKGIHSARICLAHVIMPGTFPDDILRSARDRAIEYSCRSKAWNNIPWRG